MAPMMTTTPGELQFTAPLVNVKFAASGNPKAKGRWTMSGLAAVFNLRSHDLGGFRTEIDPAFFDEILATDPDVHLVRDHNMLYVLGRTRNESLKLSVVDEGLSVWAMFPKTRVAEDTAAEMADGYVDQMSFACEIGEDVWYEDADGTIVRRLLNCSGLFDVTICAQGAFPQTESKLAASLTRGDAGDVLASAREAGRVHTHAEYTQGQQDTQGTVTAEERGEHEVTPVTAGLDDIVTQTEMSAGAPTVTERGGRDLTALQGWADARFSAVSNPE